MSYSIIGGADGPTSVFIAGQIGCGWFNADGLNSGDSIGSGIWHWTYLCYI